MKSKVVFFCSLLFSSVMQAGVRWGGRMRCMWPVPGLILMLALPAWADCPDRYRDTTAGEKAAWDRVSRSFPEFVRTPAEYALKKSDLSVSRKGRCVGEENDPIYLPVYMHFELKGEARRKLNEQLELLQQEKMAVIRKYQPRFAPLQSALEQLFSAGRATDEVLRKSREINRKIEALAEQQERELTPYEMRTKRLMAKADIRVDAYFNDETSECRGKPAELSGVTAACIKHFEDGSARLTVLLGSWRKDGEGWTAAFDGGKPPHALQTLEVSILATDAMDLKTMVDWKSAAALLESEAQ